MLTALNRDRNTRLWLKLILINSCNGHLETWVAVDVCHKIHNYSLSAQPPLSFTVTEKGASYNTHLLQYFFFPPTSFPSENDFALFDTDVCFWFMFLVHWVANHSVFGDQDCCSAPTEKSGMLHLHDITVSRKLLKNVTYPQLLITLKGMRSTFRDTPNFPLSTVLLKTWASVFQSRPVEKGDRCVLVC